MYLYMYVYIYIICINICVSYIIYIYIYRLLNPECKTNDICTDCTQGESLRMQRLNYPTCMFLPEIISSSPIPYTHIYSIY